MKQILVLLVFAALALAGCTSTHTRVYDIQVRNETDVPITIWLTKDAPPFDAGWRSPEQVALRAPGHDERIGGMVVPPGKTAFTGELKGRFVEHSYAWLRVYEGQYKRFSDLLSVSSKSPLRVDYPLDPGRNLLVVRHAEGRLQVDSEGQLEAPTTR